MTAPPSGMQPPGKQAAFESLLAEGVAALHLDARAEGVVVPPWLTARGWLVLNYSYRYNIKDFTVDAEGVHASLSFGGRPFPCWVPWPAIFAVSSEDRRKMWVYRPSVPDDQLGALLGDEADTVLPAGAVLERDGETVRIWSGAATDAAPKRPARHPQRSRPVAAAAAAKADEPPQGAVAVVPSARRSSGLRVVDGGRSDGDVPPSGMRGNHLRRVK